MGQWMPTGATAAAVAASIERGIATGALQAGSRLPSIRRLAAELDLSPGTVAAAYRDVRDRGLVVTQQRSRTIVSHRPPLATPRTVPPAPDARDLASGNPDPQLLAPRLRDVDLGMRLYGEAPVWAPLAARARAWMSADGIAADHLVATSGGRDAIERVLLAHIRPGDRLGVEDPGDTGVIDLVRALGCEPVGMAVDDEGVLPTALEDALRAAVTGVVVTPRAQNPWGSAFTPGRARELAAVLQRDPEALVVEHDHAVEVAGAPALTLTGGRARWAVIRSLSKAIGPDLRVALAAGDVTTMRRVEGRQSLGAGWVSQILQRLALAAWQDAVATGALEAAAATYARRRAGALYALRRRGFDPHGRSGFNLWIPVPGEAAVVEGLRARGWAVQPGEPYRLQSPPGIRVTAATLGAAEATRFVDDLADVTGFVRPRPA